MGKSSVLLIDLHRLISARQWWISPKKYVCDERINYSFFLTYGTGLRKVCPSLRRYVRRTGSGEPIRRYNVVMSAAHDSLLYARVETVLAGEITDGDLKVGDQLPTEDSLVARFGVSRITVRRAIQNLVSRGLVEIRRGKGTFVAAPKIMQDLKELSGFVEDMHALGHQPTARVIAKEIVPANATVARQLALTRGERVVRIRRVRLADGVPLSFDETYLPLEIGKKIITDNLKVEPIF